MSDKHLLENIYLFKGLNNEQLDLIEELATMSTFNPGDDIFSQGDKAQALYIIKYGSIRIHQKADSGDNIEVAVLGTGSHFGEMAVLDGEPRSATATAIEKTDVVEIDFEKLKSVLSEHPLIALHFYNKLAHFLCGRLRITTNDLSFAREKNLSHF